MAEEDDRQTTGPDVENCCNNPAQREARNAANTVTRGATIRESGPDTDQEARSDKHHKVISDMGVKAANPQSDDGWYEEQPYNKCEPFIALIPCRTIYDAAYDARGAHDPTVRKEIYCSSQANNSASYEAEYPFLLHCACPFRYSFYCDLDQPGVVLQGKPFTSGSSQLTRTAR